MTLITTLVALALGGPAVSLLVNVMLLRRKRTDAATRIPTPSVSVLVPARNEAVNLARLIPTLLEQDYGTFEVIIVDDASDDDTWDVLESFTDPRLRKLRSLGPPTGWVGKAHALFTATRYASGEVLLFLDADTALRDGRALSRLVDRFVNSPPQSVLTGVVQLAGGGQLLVSMVPFAILAFVPLPLAHRAPWRRFHGLNGQCWMIERHHYERWGPHYACRGEVLEDVRIGAYLADRGMHIATADLQSEIRVWMYADHRAAWVGFRKNAYPFMGQTWWRFALTHAGYTTLFVAAPFLSPWFLVAWYALKLTSDRYVQAPWWVTLATPLSFVLWGVLQIDSAIAHWTGRARWKGRFIARQTLRDPA